MLSWMSSEGPEALNWDRAGLSERSVWQNAARVAIDEKDIVHAKLANMKKLPIPENRAARVRVAVALPPDGATAVVRIALLVYPGCLASGITGPLDVFRVIDALRAYVPYKTAPRFEVSLISCGGGSVTSSAGISVASTRAGDLREFEVLFLPGLDHQARGEMDAKLAALNAEAVWLQRALADRHAHALVVSTCSSTCLVAASGALDGHRATVSWWLAPYFQARFPKVSLDAHELIVSDGRFVSSGGAASYLDLALWLVAKFGGEPLRQAVARILAIDAQRHSQAPYVMQAVLQSPGYAIVERAQRWLNRHLGEPVVLADLATHCHVSQRTLLRRFREATGESPEGALQQLRVERAQGLLESTALPFEQITASCGYTDASAFRRVFKRRAGVTPQDYRRRFGLRR